MKAFVNANPRDLQHAATLLRQAHRDGRTAALAGGGTTRLPPATAAVTRSRLAG